MRVRLAEHEVEAIQEGAAEKLLRCLDVADLVIILTPGKAPMYAWEIRERAHA
jgi:hypothetical protein